MQSVIKNASLHIVTSLGKYSLKMKRSYSEQVLPYPESANECDKILQFETSRQIHTISLSKYRGVAKYHLQSCVT